ncbi:MAG: ribose-phosphate pyrophosphokinase [Spirochaetes bacterium]|nr:MAG: ribose-phosphate pyrophosphokinase [Spirochaetota bacterium]
MENIVVVGSVADNPVAEDIAHFMGQNDDYQDLISLKSFLNTEFCPRFITTGRNSDTVGDNLKGKTVILVSTNQGIHSRNGLGMRNFLIARAAKDNGAQRVILIEPDLYYSAQDRGPRKEHGLTGTKRSKRDFEKFDGQPFSARLYADLLKVSGVDEVVTIHNHSTSVQNIFMDRFSGKFHNLRPFDLYSNYLVDTDVVNERNMVLCAPDKGALDFVRKVQSTLGDKSIPVIIMDKHRAGERKVNITVSKDSDIGLSDINGKDVVVLDDMVRTGSTIVETCHKLRSANPNKIVFFVTHFYSSRECRANLNDRVLDEIITTTTIPSILNRDVQGRLRHKMVVLLISRWISNYLLQLLDNNHPGLKSPLYSEDMSAKNPRWIGKMGPLFSDS